MTFDSIPGPLEAQAFAVGPAAELGDTPVRRLTAQDIVNARRVIEGPSDQLRAISCVKYPWVRDLWKTMLGNDWKVEKVTLVKDKQDYQTVLSTKQQQALRRSLAFLSNLDAIQTENLSENVGLIITDPSIKQLIARQQFEEYVHVDMYSTMVETLFRDPMDVYDLYRVLPALAAKNDFITEQNAAVTNEPSPENKIKAFVSNLALEGVYFYNGFLTVYAINRDTGKMNGATDGIKYIQRDEITHLQLFSNIYLSCKAERPELFTRKLQRECQEILEHAAHLEGSWGEIVIDGGIPGFNDHVAKKYPQHRAEVVAKKVGLGGIFEGTNPVPWADDYALMNNTQGNFFESKPMSYTENKPTFSRVRRIAA